jgi:hypothetical protein
MLHTAANLRANGAFGASANGARVSGMLTLALEEELNIGAIRRVALTEVAADLDPAKSSLNATRELYLHPRGNVRFGVPADPHSQDPGAPKKQQTNKQTNSDAHGRNALG